jgi:hypothetical protein
LKRNTVEEAHGSALPETVNLVDRRDLNSIYVAKDIRTVISTPEDSVTYQGPIGHSRMHSYCPVEVRLSCRHYGQIERQGRRLGQGVVVRGSCTNDRAGRQGQRKYWNWGLVRGVEVGRPRRPRAVVVVEVIEVEGLRAVVSVGGVVDDVLACAISRRKVAIAAGSTKLGVVIVVFVCEG